MKRRHAILRWLVLLLLLGAATTIAVAWGLAAWLPQRNWDETMRGTTRFHQADLLTLAEYRTRGGLRRAWYIEEFGARRFHPFLNAIDAPASTLGPVYSADQLHGPRWGVAHSLLADPAAVTDDGMEHATGWPVLAAWYGVSVAYVANAPVTQTEGGVPLPTERPLNSFLFEAHNIRALPLHPIWPGLLIDTTFYAPLWLIPLAGLRAARRAYRRSRNRCPNCAYDLTGLSPHDNTLVCPECGRVQRTPARA